MYSLLLVIVIIVLSFLSFWKKRALSVYILLTLSCYVLMAYNYDNPDYENYVLRYEGAEYPGEGNILMMLDVSNNIIQSFFKDIGVDSYQQFQKIQSFFVILVLSLFIGKYCINRNVYMLLYLLFYLMLDIVQIRAFVGFIILLPFMLCFRNRDLKSMIIFLAGVLFATTFHFSMIFFSVFSLYFIRSRKVLIVLFLLLVAFSSSIITMISLSASAEHVSGYNQPSLLGGLYAVSFVVLNYLLMKKVFCRLNHQYGEKQLFFANTDAVLAINSILLLIIPIYFVSTSISRVFRLISLYNLVFILNTIQFAPKKQKLVLSLFTFLYVLYFGQLAANLPGVFNSFIHNNSILVFFI